MEEKKNSKKGMNKGKTTSTTKSSTKGSAKSTTTKKNVKSAKATAPKTTKKTTPKTNKTKVVKPVIEEKEESYVTTKSVVKKSKIGEMISEWHENTPFFVSTLICIILLCLLILFAVFGRVPRTSDGKDIIASINGKEITADDLYNDLKSEYGVNTLVNMIDEYIANKLVTSDEDLEEAEDYVKEAIEYYKNYAEQYGVDFETFLSNYVGISGVTTEKQFHDFILNDYKKTLAVRNFLAKDFTDKEIKEYYDDNYSKSMTVKHILIEIEDDDEDAAIEQADELIAELKKVKNDKDELNKKFDELAYDYSADSTYSNGGLIENFSKSDVVEEFWNASSKLKNNEFTTEAVKTEYGYHIILKVSSNEGKKLKDVEDEVRKALAKEKLEGDSTLSITSWDELRKEYKLKINDKKIKKLYDDKISSYNSNESDDNTDDDNNNDNSENEKED